ncbi:hypothetical protein AB0E69_15300 [Kribbella sp. NPDC026611]|uniref:hypothetical protein n=1 Tax=Kribbella sp. NPDC026611 TaxID=3154911 RepID=UPI0033D403B4
MTQIEFEVETTYDLPTRAGLLVPGQLKTGTISQGATLRTTTDQAVHVLAIEFPSSAASAHPATKRVTLLVDRTTAPNLPPGTILT